MALSFQNRGLPLHKLQNALQERSSLFNHKRRSIAGAVFPSSPPRASSSYRPTSRKDVKTVPIAEKFGLVDTFVEEEEGTKMRLLKSAPELKKPWGSPMLLVPLSICIQSAFPETAMAALALPGTLEKASPKILLRHHDLLLALTVFVTILAVQED